MKRWYVFLLLGVAFVFALGACSQGNGDGHNIVSSDGQSGESETTSDEPASEEPGETIVAQINDDFDNALSPMGQMALGMLKLDDGALAVSQDQAADLLPLWQALQSLSNSQTAAQVELDAVVKQIQGTLSTEQVASIAEMQLTEDSLTEFMESGGLGFGGFRGLGGQRGDGEGGGLPGGFPGGFGGLPGGRPGGGPGGFGGNLSEDDIATRRAEFAESGHGDMQERLLTSAVVRLIQTKTGASPADRGALFNTLFEVMTVETGLSIEEIRAQTAEGQTLAEIVEANGGDVEAVRAALVEAFGELPNAQEFDAEQLADQWLGEQ
jgi:hypothetical protein